LNRALLRANDHIMPGADIRLDAGRAAAVPAPPVQRMRPALLPPITLPPIEKDLHVRVSREVSRQGLPDIGPIPRHDYQGSNHPGRRRVRRAAVRWHRASLCIEWESSNSIRGYLAAAEWVLAITAGTAVGFDAISPASGSARVQPVDRAVFLVNKTDFRVGIL
jgi:hypothetical protein